MWDACGVSEHWTPATTARDDYRRAWPAPAGVISAGFLALACSAAAVVIILGIAVLVDALLVRLMIGAILLRFVGGPPGACGDGSTSSWR
jgi:hypothetical protein